MSSIYFLQFQKGMTPKVLVTVESTPGCQFQTRMMFSDHNKWQVEEETDDYHWSCFPALLYILIIHPLLLLISNLRNNKRFIWCFYYLPIELSTSKLIFLFFQHTQEF